MTPADRACPVPFTKQFHTKDGYHDGGVSCGIGFTIAWQRGPVPDLDHRNGAFLEEVLIACLDELECHQSGHFANEYNAKALEHLTAAITTLQARIKDRTERGVIGKHEI